MKDSYRVLSGCYDRLMKDFDYDKYFAMVTPFIKGKVLECGIGSGEFTCQYITKVDQVIGIDISAEMLNIAANKLVKHRRKIILLNEDLTDFQLSYSVDSAIAICDTFNYIENIDVVMSRIANSLNSGGYFIFDISSDYKLREIIGNNVFYEDYDDMTYIWTNSINDNAIDMDITIFSFNSGEDKYSRSDESHRQYIHDFTVVNTVINKYFVLDGVYNDAFESYTDSEKTTRWIFVCRKP